MKSSELYDAITKIDDKLIERADRARLHPASDTQGNRSSGNELPVNGKIGAGRLAAVSGTVLAAVFVMAVILAFVGIGENNGNRVTAEKTQTGGSSTVYYSLNGKYVLSASISSPQTVKITAASSLYVLLVLKVRMLRTGSILFPFPSLTGFMRRTLKLVLKKATQLLSLTKMGIIFRT